MAETESNKKTKWIVVSIFIIVLLNTCFNLEKFPSYYWSEGVYIERGINFIKQGQVYSDPSFIDHPPLGWIIPSLVFKVLNFPDSIVSMQMSSSAPDVERTIIFLALIPRLIGVIFTMATAILVYKISLAIYGNKNMAIFSLASFAMIPAMWPFRNLQLDPIMITFVLLSLFILLPKDLNRKISGVVLERQVPFKIVISGVLFGIAILVKFTAIFFLPSIILFAIGYGLNSFRSTQPGSVSHSNNSTAVQITRKRRILFGVLWIIPVLGFIFSLLLFFVTNQHTLHNLVSTQLWQIGRQSFLPPWIALLLLFIASPVALCFGIIGLARTLLDKDHRIFGVAGVPYLGFLFRGGYIEWTHVIPMLPLLSIYAGKPLYQLAPKIFCRSRLAKKSTNDFGYRINYFVIGLCIASLCATIWFASFDETKPSREAIQFMISILPKNALLVTDPGYGWIISVYRPDLNVVDYYALNKMSDIPDSFYIADRPNSLSYDPTLKNSEALFDKACPVKEFNNDLSDNSFHPYFLVPNKWWDVKVKYYNAKGCTNS